MKKGDITSLEIPLEQDSSFYKELSQHLSRLLHQQATLIGLPTLQGVTYVKALDILFLKGESAQASLHMTDGKHYIVNRTLRECEDKLNPLGFCRIHKSYIVNLQQIRKYSKGEGRTVELADGTKIDVTRGYYESFISKVTIL